MMEKWSGKIFHQFVEVTCSYLDGIKCSNSEVKLNNILMNQHFVR